MLHRVAYTCYTPGVHSCLHLLCTCCTDLPALAIHMLYRVVCTCYALGVQSYLHMLYTCCTEFSELAIHLVYRVVCTCFTPSVHSYFLLQGCAGSPNDSRQQQSLRSAAEDLRSATNAAAQNALKKKQLQRLDSAARQACSAATQLGNASEAAAHFNRNQPSQQELSSQCKDVLDQVPVLVAAMRDARHNPDSVQAVRTLIDSSNALLQVGAKVTITQVLTPHCTLACALIQEVALLVLYQKVKQPFAEAYRERI